MGYKFTRSAERDLIDIYVTGTKEFGTQQAEAYLAKLEQSFALLAEYPRLARQRHELTPAVRIHPCGTHVIVYDIDENGDILVIRVRHGNEDWIKHPTEKP